MMYSYGNGYNWSAFGSWHREWSIGALDRPDDLAFLDKIMYVPRQSPIMTMLQYCFLTYLSWSWASALWEYFCTHTYFLMYIWDYFLVALLICHMCLYFLMYFYILFEMYLMLMYQRLEMSCLTVIQLVGNQGIHAGDRYPGVGHQLRGLWWCHILLYFWWLRRYKFH